MWNTFRHLPYKLGFSVSHGPEECVSVYVCFDLSPIDVELFQRDKAFLFQTAHKLIIQFIQNFFRQFFPCMFE